MRLKGSAGVPLYRVGWSKRYSGARKQTVHSSKGQCEGRAQLKAREEGNGSNGQVASGKKNERSDLPVALVAPR